MKVIAFAHAKKLSGLQVLACAALTGNRYVAKDHSKLFMICYYNKVMLLIFRMFVVLCFFE